MSTIEVNTIDSVSGTSNLTIGSGNSSQITLKSGATLTNFPNNTPAFSVTKSADQSLSGGDTTTTITFDTEVLDTDGAFASNTFTVPSGKGGFYFLCLNLTYSNYQNLRGIANIKKNGSTALARFETYGNNDGSIDPAATCAGVFNLSEGDAITATAYNDSAGSKDVRSDTVFCGYKLIGV